MTLGQFRKQTAKMPDDLELFIERNLHVDPTDFPIAPVDEIEKKEVPFREEPDGPELTRYQVLVIKEDMD